MGLWFLVFFLTPIVEMYLLIEVGGYIGALQTIALVMLTAVIGIALLRSQGMATLTRGADRLRRGEIPATEVAEGLLLAVAGALLITPGFVTDGIGFLLLIPSGRGVVAGRLLSKVTVAGAGLRPDDSPFVDEPPFEKGASLERRYTIIEGEFERRPGDERADGHDR